MATLLPITKAAKSPTGAMDPALASVSDCDKSADSGDSPRQMAKPFVAPSSSVSRFDGTPVTTCWLLTRPARLTRLSAGESRIKADAASSLRLR